MKRLGLNGEEMDLSFYKNKKIFITGHTGFKGAWLCQVLLSAGADVAGYALEPPTTPSLFNILNLKEKINSITADVRDLGSLKKALDESRAEVVFHLAAQPLVLRSYEEPCYTYETNVMGTVNVLECVRLSDTVKSFLNVTTDKVYENKNLEHCFSEDEPLCGFDPYSNSKSCSELITSSYKNSFFSDSKTAISTARAGNVIGGGDFSDNRIIPDCIRAARKNLNIQMRNPKSIRPYQHVLESLSAYLTIARRQYEDINCAGSYNVGPEESDCITTQELVQMFCEKWGCGLTAECVQKENAPHEHAYLKLDCSKIKTKLGWKPSWNIEQATEKVVEWEKAEDKERITLKQIAEYSAD